MSVNQKLTHIINRLDALERAVARVGLALSTPAPCCQSLQVPGGGELPLLPPPDPDEPIAQDDVCGRVAAMLRLYVRSWNDVVVRRYDWLPAGAAGLWAVLSSGGTNPFVAAMSYSTVLRWFDLVLPIVDQLLLIDYESLDECRAVRQYLATGGIPNELNTYINPIARPIFAMVWLTTGQGKWYDEMPPVTLSPISCCLPDTFTLSAQPADVVCGSFSYRLGVLSASDPAYAIRQIAVRSGNLTWLRREVIGGFWIRNVQGGGAFGYQYWLRSSPTSSGCAILRPQDGGTTPADGGMPNEQWFLVLPGSGYLLFRLPTESENSIIEVSREQPQNWDGVSTI